MLSWIFRALRLGGILTSPQATPLGLQMTPPSLPGTENPRKHGSPDFILIIFDSIMTTVPVHLIAWFLLLKLVAGSPMVRFMTVYLEFHLIRQLLYIVLCNVRTFIDKS